MEHQAAGFVSDVRTSQKRALKMQKRDLRTEKHRINTEVCRLVSIQALCWWIFTQALVVLREGGTRILFYKQTG